MQKQHSPHNVEEVKFKVAISGVSIRVGISGTYWDRLPHYRILVDGVSYYNGTVGEETLFLEFTAELEEEQEHTLEIRLENKLKIDVVMDKETGQIQKDMLLNIESIEIEDIEIGMIKWNNSVYHPDDQTIEPIKNCVNLGMNGTWKLKFASPVYLWLLENM